MQCLNIYSALTTAGNLEGHIPECLFDAARNASSSHVVDELK